MTKPTHFVLNNADANFCVEFVGTAEECIAHCKTFDEEEDSDSPYGYRKDEKIESSHLHGDQVIHRFDFYLGSWWVLPIGVDLASTPNQRPVASMFELPENEDEEEEQKK